MFDLSKFSKEQLVEMIRMFGDNAITIDGLWFTGVEDKYSLDAAVQIDTQTWEKYGAIEARRIKERLNIKEDGLDGLSRALNFQIWIWAKGFDYKIERDGNILVFTITDCRVQKVRIKSGRGEFPCKPVGIALFREFAKAFGKNIKTSCLVCPPDKHPEDVWCSWEFTTE